MKKKISCIIIDDEPPASEVLKFYIEKVPDFELKAIYNDAIKALSELREETVDVIFCDIEMPDINGLQFVSAFASESKPLFVFVSAHSKYAIEGFNLDAVDYLMKPVSFPRFFKTTQKIINLLLHRDEVRPAAIEPETDIPQDYFFVKTNNKLVKINFNDILYIEGFSDYVRIHLEGSEKSILALNSLKNLEDILLPYHFKRIHRSYIVPVHKITAIEQKKAVLNKGLSLPISNSYYESLYKLLVSNKIFR